MTERAPLSADEIRALGAKYGSWTAAARATGRSISAIKSRASHFGIKIGDVSHDRPETAVTSEDPAEWGDVRKLIESRGLNPELFLVTRVRVNEWADERQLRVDLEPVESVVMPARTDGWKAPKPRPRSTKNGELVAFLSDQHVPFQDEDLHRAVVQWLKDEQPHKVVLLGDLIDADQLSRYERNPEHTSDTQTAVNEAYRLLRDYRQAAPDAEFVMVAGNHEERLRASVIKHLGALYGIRRADEGGPSVLSFEYLLRLDELRIDFIRSEAGGYEHARVKVSPELQAIHGWVARKGSGASAAAHLDHLRVSTIHGHTHRAGLIFKTQWSIDNQPRTLVAAETGTLGQIQDGLSHAPRPDWNQGFATATVWPDGLFNVDLAVYVDETLMWRGKRW